MAHGKVKGPKDDPMKGFQEALEKALADVKNERDLWGKTCNVHFRAEITSNPGDVGWYRVDITP